MSFTVFIVFASIQVITNEDGSHTPVNEEHEKELTVNAKTSHDSLTAIERKAVDHFVTELSDIEFDHDEARIGYYKFHEEIEAGFLIKFHADEFYLCMQVMKYHLKKFLLMDKLLCLVNGLIRHIFLVLMSMV